MVSMLVPQPTDNPRDPLVSQMYLLALFARYLDQSCFSKTQANNALLFRTGHK